MRVFHFFENCRPMRPLILVVSIAAGLLAGSTLHSRTVQSNEIVCESEFRAADNTVFHVTLPNGSPLDLDTAWMHFRFNRPKEALLKLDAAQKMAAGAWGLRIPADRRKEVTSDLAAFRTCIATHQPPALAAMTARTFLMDPDPSSGRRVPEGAGVSITVDGVPVGSTRGDGTLTVKVPSGKLRVNAIVPPNSWGEASIELAPGGSGTASIVLDPDKEIGEDTDVVLAEAVDDIIPATSKSFTLRFMREGVIVPVAEAFVAIELRSGGEESIDDRFGIDDGAITAKDPACARLSCTRPPRLKLIGRAGCCISSMPIRSRSRLAWNWPSRDGHRSQPSDPRCSKTSSSAAWCHATRPIEDMDRRSTLVADYCGVSAEWLGARNVPERQRFVVAVSQGLQFIRPRIQGSGISRPHGGRRVPGLRRSRATSRC